MSSVSKSRVSRRTATRTLIAAIGSLALAMVAVGAAVPVQAAPVHNGAPQSVNQKQAPGDPIGTLDLSLSTTPASFSAVGQIVSTTYVLKNNGTATVTDILVAATMVAPAAPNPQVTCPYAVLSAGQSETCTSSYSVTQTDINNGTLAASAVATGTSAAQSIQSTTENWSIGAAQTAAITSFNLNYAPAQWTTVGQQVAYSYTVYNTGNVDVSSLTNTITQTGTPNVLGSFSPVICAATALAPGGSTSCTTNLTVTQAALDAYSYPTFTFTPSAVGPTGLPATLGSPIVTAAYYTQQPALTLSKAASPDPAVQGQVVTYSFTIRNNGNVTMSGISINDIMAYPATQAGLSAISCGASVLAAGAQTTCAATYTVTAADVTLGYIYNYANAQGNTPNGGLIYSNLATKTVSTRPAAQLTASITDNNTTIETVGENTTFTTTVTNTGTVPISSVYVIDTFAPPANSPLVPVSVFATCAATSLAPGQSTTCTFTRTATQADLDKGSVTVTSVAHGYPPTGLLVDSNGDSITQQATMLPSLQLTKSASVATYAYVGQQFYYYFQVTNNGNVTIFNPTVNDSMTSPSVAGGLGEPHCDWQTIVPGAAGYCYALYTVTQADVDNGVINNSATMSALDPLLRPFTSNVSTASVPVAAFNNLGLIKTSNTSYLTKAGQQVSYKFQVTNYGYNTVHGISVTDVLTSPAQLSNLSSIVCPVTTLAPTATTTCTATYTASQADVDAGRIQNTATATGTNAYGQPVTSGQSAVYVTIGQAPALTIAKSATPATATQVGQSITYKFVVTNTGNLTETNIAIVDTMNAPAGTTTGISGGASTLAPGASTTFTGTYLVTAADLAHGSISNSAYSTGKTPAGGTTTSNVSTASIVAYPVGAISLVKTVTTTAVTSVGQQVQYDFAVTNNAVAPLASGLAVTDTVAAPSTAAGLSAVNCPAVILIGATVHCTATYTVTAADIANGVLTDTATASALPPIGAAVTSNPSSVTVPVSANGAITLTKTASIPVVTLAGQVEVYTFTISNTGAVPLSGISVTDHFDAPALDTGMSAISCPTTLAAGATTSCTATYTVTQTDIDNGTISNTATVVASDPAGVAVSAGTTALVTTNQYATSTLSMYKTVTGGPVSAAGQVLQYLFHVTNTGFQTITGINIVDTPTAPATAANLSTVTCPTTTLAAGASEICAATYTTTQADVDSNTLYVTNVAVANGTSPNGSAVNSLQSTVSAAVSPQPRVTLVKTSTPTTVSSAGQTITYKFLVTNVGNQTLHSPAVSDFPYYPATSGQLGPVSCPSPTLAPHASETCTGVYTVSAADIANGAVANYAYATMEVPNNGTVVSDWSIATVAVTPAPNLQLVKSANPTTFDAVGQTITYSFLVTNNGPGDAENISVDDTLRSPAAPAVTVVCPVATLVSGASEKCTATYVTTQADLDHGSINNFAVAHADDFGGNQYSSPTSEAVVDAVQRSQMSLVKTANPTSVSAVGETITYSFTVTNDGNTTESGIAVGDSFASPAQNSGLSPITGPSTPLAPGASATYTATYAATQADVDNGIIVNEASASAVDPAGGTVGTAPSSATVVVDQSSTITLVKSATPTVVHAVGQVVTYSFKVTNTGNVTQSSLTIVDTLSAPAGPALNVTCPVSSLNAGDSTTCTASYAVTAADVTNGVIDNSAVAESKTPLGASISSSPSSARVTVEDANANAAASAAADANGNPAAVAAAQGDNTSAASAAADASSAAAAQAAAVSSASTDASSDAASAANAAAQAAASAAADADNSSSTNAAATAAANSNASAAASSAATASSSADASSAASSNANAAASAAADANGNVAAVAAAQGDNTAAASAAADASSAAAAQAAAVSSASTDASSDAASAANAAAQAAASAAADADNSSSTNAAATAAANSNASAAASSAATASSSADASSAASSNANAAASAAADANGNAAAVAAAQGDNTAAASAAADASSAAAAQAAAVSSASTDASSDAASAANAAAQAAASAAADADNSSSTNAAATAAANSNASAAASSAATASSSADASSAASSNANAAASAAADANGNVAAVAAAQGDNTAAASAAADASSAAAAQAAAVSSASTDASSDAASAANAAAQAAASAAADADNSSSTNAAATAAANSNASAAASSAATASSSADASSTSSASSTSTASATASGSASSNGSTFLSNSSQAFASGSGNVGNGLARTGADLVGPLAAGSILIVGGLLFWILAGARRRRSEAERSNR